MGAFTTISGAIEAAVSGDVVLVRPGTYVESILIDKDITLRGDGDRADVVIRSSSDRPDRWLPGEERTYAIRLQETDARVENVTLTGPASALIVQGGAPRIEGVALIDVGVTNCGDDMGGVEVRWPHALGGTEGRGPRQRLPPVGRGRGRVNGGPPGE